MILQNQEIIEWIRQNGKGKTFHKGEYLYQIGEKSIGVYFILSGLISLVATTPQKKDHLLRLFRSREFCGYRAFFAEETYHAKAVALKSTLVFLLEPLVWQKLLKTFPPINAFFLKSLAQELGRSEIRLSHWPDQTVKQRVAEALIFLKEQSPNHGWTRKEIAEFCASTTSTVIKTLAQLEAEGYIEQKGREIKIIQADKLLNIMF